MFFPKRKGRAVSTVDHDGNEVPQHLPDYPDKMGTNQHRGGLHASF
jgi:hypothetical protein